jgi:protein disulfide-isomerase-like protein
MDKVLLTLLGLLLVFASFILFALNQTDNLNEKKVQFKEYFSEGDHPPTNYSYNGTITNHPEEEQQENFTQEEYINLAPHTAIRPYSNIENFYGGDSGNAKLKLFYADWCGHCKRFKPVFDGELKELVSNKKIPVQLEAIDCDQNPQIASKYKVSGFPTLILEVNDKPIEYQGNRKSENIIEFIKEHLNF